VHHGKKGLWTKRRIAQGLAQRRLLKIKRQKRTFVKRADRDKRGKDRSSLSARSLRPGFAAAELTLASAEVLPGNDKGLGIGALIQLKLKRHRRPWPTGEGDCRCRRHNEGNESLDMFLRIEGEKQGLVVDLPFCSFRAAVGQVSRKTTDCQ